MNLLYQHLVLGQLGNNVYVLWDDDTKKAVVIDPEAYAPSLDALLVEIVLTLRQIWFTHAHFDHFAGSAALLKRADVPVLLHPADEFLRASNGGADFFGIQVDPLPATSALQAGQWLDLDPQGTQKVCQVLHTPGHTPGHVVFACAAINTVFCGDLIFRGSVGRTDLPRGSHAQLLDSIKQHIFTLPPATRLAPGHGDATTVAEELQTNPFFA